MNIFFYATYSNQKEFLNTLRKKFRHDKIYTLKDDFDLSKIDIAMVWNLPDQIFKKMSKFKSYFFYWGGSRPYTEINSYQKNSNNKS